MAAHIIIKRTEGRLATGIKEIAVKAAKHQITSDKPTGFTSDITHLVEDRSVIAYLASKRT